MRASLALAFFCLLAGCAGKGGLALKPGPGSGDTIDVPAVRNLAGVSLLVPEMYVGDMLGASDPVEIEEVDLKLVTEAALIGALRAREYQVTAAPGAYSLHGAVTRYEALDVRRTGRFRMAVLLILVDNRTGNEVARGEADREFELFSRPPNEIGSLGDQRFIRRKLEGFTEVLAREALRNLGLQ